MNIFDFQSLQSKYNWPVIYRLGFFVSSLNNLFCIVWIGFRTVAQDVPLLQFSIRKPRINKRVINLYCSINWENFKYMIEDINIVKEDSHNSFTYCFHIKFSSMVKPKYFFKVTSGFTNVQKVSLFDSNQFSVGLEIQWSFQLILQSLLARKTFVSSAKRKSWYVECSNLNVSNINVRQWRHLYDTSK